MHARSILENLDNSREHQYIFYAYEKNNPIEALGIQVPVQYTLVQTKTLKKSIDRPRDFLHLAKIIFHNFHNLRGMRIDAFIQFDFMLGIPNLPNIKRTLLVAYDLIPLIFRDDYIPTPSYAFTHTRGIFRKAKKTLRAYYYQMRYTIHYRNFSKADYLLSISQNTTASIVEMLHIPENKISTIPLAPVFNTEIASKPRTIAGEKRPFIFYIGATDARKRVSDLIEAFDALRQTNDVNLILAGKEFSKRKKIPSPSILKALDESPYAKNIYTIGYVSDAEKLWLYQHAEAFIFPTTYEGFGLPVVEAMQHGCPVISYNNSSIPEVAGDAAQLVKTGDILQLASEIKHILEDSDARDRMVKRGRTISKNYTWDNYIKAFYQVLETDNNE